MSGIMQIIEEMKKDCPCGKKHETAIRDVRIGSGVVTSVGDILKENGFSKNLLIVCDKHTIAAANGIFDSLSDFNITMKLYDELRVATMAHVREIEELIAGKDISVLSVGTGSLNDPCRLACARQDKFLCIFATAPSMDGFASYGAPIVDSGFKYSYDAKSPEVIIGDTKILAASPTYLKSAGFGDMIAKYTAIIDWKISALLSGEYFCERVCDITRKAIDTLMSLCDKVTENDEETAGKIFEALLLTGIGMSFSKNSRPASGAEHVIAHLIECVELRDGIVPNYHGEDVGVCTLETLKIYNKLAESESVSAVREIVDWDDVYSYYGSMAENVRKCNTPTVTEKVDPDMIEKNWQKIREIIRSVPTYEECYDAMKRAGCKLTVSNIGKSASLFSSCVKYSPFMRYRITLLRLSGMIRA